jgi:Trypsin-like peptidase domain
MISQKAMIAHAAPKGQDILAFTVQICHPDSWAIVGTGIIVAPDGLIATCVHVLEQAGVTVSDRDALVGVRFPQTRHQMRARVLPERLLPHDDVAVIQLKEPLPMSATVAILGHSVHCEDHSFQSYGFRALPPYEGGPASGTILGHGTRAADSLQRHDPLLLRSPEINQGMSGGAVLDLFTDRVIGIITATWQARGGQVKDRDSAFATPAEALVELVPNIRLHPARTSSHPFFRRIAIALAAATTLFALLIAVLWQYLPLGCGEPLVDAPTYIQRAQRHRDHDGRYACARRDFTAGLAVAKSNTERAELYYGLATVSLAENKLDEAHEFASRGLSYDAGYSLLYWGDALARCQSEQNGAAIQQLQKFRAAGGHRDVASSEIQALYSDLADGQSMVKTCANLAIELP